MTELNDTKAIPIVPLRGGVVFPGVTTTISIGRRRSLAAAQAANQAGGEILILVQYNSEIESPAEEELVPIGILASVRDVLRTSHLGVQMLVELQRRVHFDGFADSEPFLTGTYKELQDISDDRAEDLMAEAIAYLEQYAETLGELNRQVLASLRSYETAGELADYLAGILNVPFEVEIELLMSVHGVERLSMVRDYLEQELRIAEVRTKIQQEAQEGASQAQREYLLREQMKAIQKELGEDDADIADELRQKIADSGMPQEVETKALD